MITLVFFDIDGTLLQTSGAGRIAFARALKEVFGWDDPIDYINFAGATDLLVLERIMREHGAEPRPGDADRFFHALPHHLEQSLQETTSALYPGVRALVERLAADDRYLLGLVTGNIQSCAIRKLQHFDLHGHFFLGAFGHEHADRLDIARLALQRARDHVPDPSHISSRHLIGDTPSDIAAAHAIDATSIAVATGSFSRAQLEAAGARHVLDDLGDVEAVLRLLQ
jgi:phosphoglycolate phosphatase-like HAD superfamily hydrolase